MEICLLMITFDINKKNYKSYLFDEIPTMYQDYKKNLHEIWKELCSQYIDSEKITPKDFNDDCKIIGIKKFCEKVINSELYEGKRYKDKNYHLSQLWNDKIFIEEIYSKLITDNIFFKDGFLKIIFVSYKDTLAQQELGIYEEISEKDFYRFITFVLSLENFDIPNYKLEYDDLLTFYRCLENFHTHSSRYTHSSSNMSLNISKPYLQDKYLNSQTTKYGIPMTTYEGGGFGRDYSSILKSLNSVFEVNNEIISLFSILVSLKENKDSTNFEKHVLSQFNFPPEDVQPVYSLSLKIPLDDNNHTDNEERIFNTIKNKSLIKINEKKEKNYSHLPQVLWFHEGNFENLIPISSVKVFSALAVLRNKVKAKIADDIISEENITDEKKILEVTNKVSAPSISIKAVLSNAQNVSAFLSSKSGWLVRFNSYKYIKQKSSVVEKQFHFLESIMIGNKIYDKDLSAQYAKYLLEGKIKLNLLPNSVVKNMFNSFTENLAKEIVFNLKSYKKKVLALESKKIEKLAQNIVDKSSSSYYQKYVLDIITPDEINILSSKVVYMYENISTLNNEQVKILSNKIERLLCL